MFGFRLFVIPSSIRYSLLFSADVTLRDWHQIGGIKRGADVSGTTSEQLIQ